MEPDKSFPDSKPPSNSPDAGQRGGQGGGGNGRSGRRKTPDREVPLYRGQAPEQESTELLHKWLDGEIPDAAMLASVNGDDTVDLWNKIHDEAALLRNRTTPLYLHKQIMDALPDDLYQQNSNLPWYKKAVSMNPIVLTLIGVGLVAAGGFIATMVLP